MRSSFLIDLAFKHHTLELIDDNELGERVRIILWLYHGNSSTMDPRGEPERKNTSSPDDATIMLESISSENEIHDPFSQITFQKNWIFTKQDPGPYPSIPYAHKSNQNNSWPKLNPFTGRVFEKKAIEECSKRLTKEEMKKLWDNDIFLQFCINYLKWYSTLYLKHKFPVKHMFLFSKWN